MIDKLTASEAIFGFCAWLTTCKKITVMSSHHDCAPIVGLIKQFCDTNSLKDPREGWQNNLIHPTGECSGRAL